MYSHRLLHGGLSSEIESMKDALGETVGPNLDIWDEIAFFQEQSDR